MQSHQILVITAANAKLPLDDNLVPYLDNHMRDDPSLSLWPSDEGSDVRVLATFVSRPDWSAGISCDFLNPMKY